MKIIEQRNEKDPKGKWCEYEPRPTSEVKAKTLIKQLRRHADKDKSIIEEMLYRLRTINTY